MTFIKKQVILDYKIREEMNMPGIEILVSDHNGVYVPKVFTENYDTKRWNVSDSNRWSGKLRMVLGIME